jgi:hypothetical protein
VIATLDRLHARVRRSVLLERVVVATRCLFAMAFVPTGLVKALGERFTQIDPASPIGAFFEAMFQTGGYWRFLGLAQVAAGVLMLVPRTATFAAVAFFPVALNIFVITVALDFRGTPFITGPMLIGATALLAWDWHRLRGIVTLAPPASGAVRPGAEPGAPWPAWERAAYAVGTAAGLAVFAAVRSLLPMSIVRGAVVAGLLAALGAGVGALRAVRRDRATGTDGAPAGVNPRASDPPG